MQILSQGWTTCFWTQIDSCEFHSNLRTSFKIRENIFFLRNVPSWFFSLYSSRSRGPRKSGEASWIVAREEKEKRENGNKKRAKKIIKFELCPQLCNWPSAILFTLISSSHLVVVLCYRWFCFGFKFLLAFVAFCYAAPRKRPQRKRSWTMKKQKQFAKNEWVSEEERKGKKSALFACQLRVHALIFQAPEKKL